MRGVTFACKSNIAVGNGTPIALVRCEFEKLNANLPLDYRKGGVDFNE